jgi:hypothetical protein
MKTVIRALQTDRAFPVLTILMSLSGLSVMGLANLGRDATPAWHGSMTLFLTLMIGLALRDLIRASRRR